MGKPQNAHRMRPLRAERLALAVLAFLLAVNVYRAWTQAMTYDEAVTYESFVSGGLGHALVDYNANNHVLFSVLATLTTGVFGVSEFTLRLPTVAAGILYFAATFLLCRLLLGGRVLFLAVLGALTVNPFVLDFLSAARGYGLALAFWVAALYQIVLVLVTRHDRPARRWGLAGAALALSVASNLAFVFASTALAITACGLGAIVYLADDRQRGAAFVEHVGGYFCGLALLLAGAMLAVPLSHARREHFWFGAETLDQTVQSLVDASLRHHHTTYPLDTEGAIFEAMCRTLSALWIPTLCLAVLAAGISTLRGLGTDPPGRFSPSQTFLLLIAWTTSLTFSLLIIGHELLAIPYPLERTGLYLIVLFVLLAAAFARTLDLPTRLHRVATRGLTIALLLLVGQCAIQFNTNHYSSFRYDAGSKRTFERIARCGSQGQTNDPPVQVGAEPWLLAPSLSYYRDVRHATWMAPVGEILDPTQLHDDVFVVKNEEYLRPVRAVALPVYTDPVSKVVLFVNRSARPSLVSCFAAETSR
jgi:hypothetical protein